jgi:sortase (surface protein transpeptidase)
MSRPAAVAVAAGLLAIAAGTSGLLLTRHSTPALRPPPLGVATVPAPTGPIVSPSQPIARPEPGHSQSADPQSATPAPVARPVSLTIPLIGVRTPLVTLGLAANGTLQVPSSAAVAGWYTGSARPGSVGPSVIVGHVDSLSGPGVFFRLSELQPGDRVYVTRADGTMVEFRVTAVQTFLKVSFPTQAVYGGTPYPELRLITCGGTFDYATGHYLSNTIVYATESG